MRNYGFMELDEVLTRTDSAWFNSNSFIFPDFDKKGRCRATAFENNFQT